MSVYDYLFSLVKSDAAATAILGTNPVRFWRYGHAPQNEKRPYSVCQRAYGGPDNSLSCIPTEDRYGMQVDVYAKTTAEAEAAANVIRDVFEANFIPLDNENGDGWDQPTGLYNVSRTYDFWMARPSS